MSSSNFIILVCIFGCILSCANPVAPTGGPVDETPPKVIEEASTPNRQTNYIPLVTEITFDEYVQLKNPARNVIISPPVKEKPEFSLRGKTLRIDWNDADTLRAATTYTLNLSNAVVDLNEGNAVENLVFAFSTGDHLDSLECSLKVLGPDLSPQEKITVMLYEDLTDSVVRNDLPYYFAVTDSRGIAQFKYLKEGLYKLFALKDDNLNLTYDLDNEMIAFANEPLQLPLDSAAINPLRLFLPDAETALASNPKTVGMYTQFILNQVDTFAAISPFEEERFIASQWVQDTLKFWWSEPSIDSTTFRWQKEDTLLRYQVAAPDSLVTVRIRSRLPLITFKGKNASIDWKTPMKRPTDTTFFRKDSSGNRCYYGIVSHSALRTTLTLPQKECSNTQKIFALPGSLVNAYGQENTDTLEWKVNSIAEEDLAEIQLLFAKGDSSKAYIVRLWKKDQLVYKDYLIGQSAYQRNLKHLDPGSYYVEIVEDKNLNSKQDGGNYWKRQQPEWGRKITLDQLRANWILDEEIALENDSTSAKPG